ncbi:MAG: hypothetical protein CL928_10920 [Deltaproteobacteria bacterium]|nr:hypothetical protein [Deltaproteobacteria bacterium]
MSSIDKVSLWLAPLSAAVLFALPVAFAPPSVHAFSLEEFDKGFGAWKMSPRYVGRSSRPGWSIGTRAGEEAAMNSPTTAYTTYYWKLLSEVDLGKAVSPVLEVKYDFLGNNYESFAVQVGPIGARRSADYTTLYEVTEATGGESTEVVDLSEYVGQEVTVRLLLKKRYGVVERRTGLYVYRLGIRSDVSFEPTPTEPELVSVGAFNVQVFGKSKMRKADVPEILGQMIARYDLLAFQEIRDASGQALEELAGILADQTGDAFEHVVSDRLGRTRSKEQYAYFYRPDKLTLVDSYHFDDGPEPDDDVFEREPFVALWDTVAGDLDFATIVVHTSPRRAEEEVDALADVVADVVNQWGETDIVVLGDFNAGCRYLSQEQLSALALWTNPDASWWISQDADTTVSSTHCPYDRIVTLGSLTDGVVEGSSQVYLFDQDLVLSNEMARTVSDHYPVEVVLDVAGLP